MDGNLARYPTNGDSKYVIVKYKTDMLPSWLLVGMDIFHVLFSDNKESSQSVHLHHHQYSSFWESNKYRKYLPITPCHNPVGVRWFAESLIRLYSFVVF